MKRKQRFPGWLPFAFIAAGFAVVGAGIKSKWTTDADKTPSPTPPQPGPLNDWFDPRGPSGLRGL